MADNTEQAKKPIAEILVTHCGDCPACNGEFSHCQIDTNVDTGLYGTLPQDCPLRRSNVILKIDN